MHLKTDNERVERLLAATFNTSQTTRVADSTSTADLIFENALISAVSFLARVHWTARRSIWASNQLAHRHESSQEPEDRLRMGCSTKYTISGGN